MYQTSPADFITEFTKDTKWYRYPTKRQGSRFNYRYKVEIHIDGQLAYRIYGKTEDQANKRADELSAYLKLLQRKAKLDARKK